MQKYGVPSWKKLVEAVRDPAGGQDPRLAKAIASEHPGILRVGRYLINIFKGEEEMRNLECTHYTACASFQTFRIS